VISRNKAITEPSPIAQAHEEEKAREAQVAGRDTRPRERRDFQDPERIDDPVEDVDVVAVDEPNER
jgi:hypothetical protein